MNSVIRTCARWISLGALLGTSALACGGVDGSGDIGDGPGSESGSSSGSASGGSGSSSGGVTLSPGSSSGASSGGNGAGSSSGGSSSGSSSGNGDHGSDAGALPDATTSEGGPPTGGPWTGIKVSGIGFVDSAGAEFIPRGIAPGEWHNIESVYDRIEPHQRLPRNYGQTRT